MVKIPPVNIKKFTGGLIYWSLFMRIKDQHIDTTRYCIIPRTLIFIFNDRNQVLLLRGASNKRLWAGLYNGIGGHINPGEDILESAERELWEETGIKNASLQLCGQIMVDVEAERGVGIFLFRGKCNKDVFQVSDEGALFWIALDEIENYPVVADLPVIIPRIAAYRLGEMPLIGRYAYDKKGELQILLR
jgi:8-oxo-dGTP diphosphatase